MTDRMELASAIRHLRAKLAQADAAESRNRPKWTQADMDAVAALVDIPASAEQIALARIEGRAANGNAYSTPSREEMNAILQISRRALGLVKEARA